MFQFTRFRTTPVLAKGATYDTWVADALAAPAACWDGTRFVMTVSAWDIVRGKWASLFFSSPDLETWTYIPGSLRAPNPGDYILGNGSIAWFNNRYYFCYSHYTVGPVATALQYSTDLLTWTTVGDPMFSPAADSGLNIDPDTGRLELWCMDDSDRSIHFHSSADGFTWTDHGLYQTAPPWTYTGSTYGEAHAIVYGGIRYLMSDVNAHSGVAGSVARLRALFESTGKDTAWSSRGSCLGFDPLNAWESAQVFDGHIVGALDRGDGRGTKFWALYAGGDVYSIDDNTSSSIGLAYMDAPGAIEPTAQSIACSFAGVGAATVSGTIERYAVATAEGTGTASLAATLERPAAATFAGTGTATLTATVEQLAAATFAGAGAATLTATVERFGAATFDGIGAATLTATVEVAGEQAATATFAGVGTAILAITPERTIAATFGGEGAASLTAVVEVSGAKAAVAAFAGVGTAALGATVERFVVAPVLGVGGLAVTATVERFAAATWMGTGQAIVKVTRPAAASFRLGLYAFLTRLPGVAVKVGNRVYFARLPQKPTYPAIVYTIPSDVAGRDLRGLDGTRAARVDLGLFARDQQDLDDLAAAIELGFRSLNPEGIDGDMAGVTVRWVRQEEQADLPEPEGLGGDAVKPFLAVEYAINYFDPLTPR